MNTGARGGSLSTSAKAFRLAPSTSRRSSTARTTRRPARPARSRTTTCPSERLGRSEPAFFRQEARAGARGSVVEDVRQPAACLAASPPPSRAAPLRGGKRRELHDRAPERAAADLGPGRVGPASARRRPRRPPQFEELAHEARLADAELPHDARRRRASAASARRASSQSRSSSRPMNGKGNGMLAPRRRPRGAASCAARRPAADVGAHRAAGGDRHHGVAVVGAPHSPQNFWRGRIERAARGAPRRTRRRSAPAHAVFDLRERAR